MPIPWQCTFHHFRKVCLVHVHLKANMCAKFHLKCFKNVEVIRSTNFLIFCHNMPLPLQHTSHHCQKKCRTHLHLKANKCAQFYLNKMPQTVEVIWFTSFSSKLCRNMPLPWQRTFRYCQKMCCSHPHLKVKMCAKSNWNPWKHSATITRNVRKTLGLTFCTQAHGRRDRYHDNALSATVKKSVSLISSPEGQCVCRVSLKSMKA